MSIGPPAIPANRPTCPGCGGPNGCGPSHAGTFAARCWCEDVRVDPELLRRMRADGAPPACLCRRCVAAAAAAGGAASSAQR